MLKKSVGSQSAFADVLFNLVGDLQKNMDGYKNVLCPRDCGERCYRLERFPKAEQLAISILLNATLLSLTRAAPDGRMFSYLDCLAEAATTVWLEHPRCSSRPVTRLLSLCSSLLGLLIRRHWWLCGTRLRARASGYCKGFSSREYVSLSRSALAADETIAETI